MIQRGRLVLLKTSPRVAPGLLSADAWAAVMAGPVFVASTSRPPPALVTAGAAFRQLGPDLSDDDLIGTLTAAAAGTTATWWTGSDDVSEDFMLALIAAADIDNVKVDPMLGSWDLPGARLLDVVATMDRLRSPGGCPWDAKQTHESLAPYLLEEAYETFQAIEDGSSTGLREELGDVLLQVAFHARLAAELPTPQRWTIDDVATGLVDKLVRRHPHVFGDVTVADADEVNANWEAIKATERGDASVLSNVPMAAAALTLAATLQRKATRAGMDDLGVEPIDAAAGRFAADPTADAAGQLLWSTVAAMRERGIDAEAALRARSRVFRDGKP